MSRYFAGETLTGWLEKLRDFAESGAKVLSNRFVSFRKKRVWIPVAALILFALFNVTIMLRSGFVPTEAQTVVKHEQPGSTLTMALHDSIEAEYAHGWIPNAKFWPTMFLWNYSDFQTGQLEVWSRVSYQFREHLSRVRTTDAIDPGLANVNSALNNDPRKFMFPSFESKILEALQGLEVYNAALPTRQNFSRRADNLAELMGNLASIMGNTQNRLAQALPNHFAIPAAETEGDVSSNERASHVDAGGVGFWKSSEVFYTAKGQAYAILTMMQAVRIEFADVLEKKNSQTLVDDTIFWLKEAIRLQPLVVLNSSRDGLFANHLDNFGVPFSQARSKINSLVDVLRNG